MKRIVVFGNPLLDTILSTKDDSLLQKYNLQADGQKEISLEEMKLLKIDINKYDKTVTTGGCGQNTLKVMQWLNKKQFSAIIVGSVGDDSEGKLLKNLLQKERVETNYIIQKKYPTGTTVALVNGEQRSLVAHLGAAEVMSKDDIKTTEQLVVEADLIYMEGFFLTKRIDAALFIADFIRDNKKAFAFNLSGEYLCLEQPEIVKHFMEKANIIFGNKREYVAMCPIMGKDNVKSLIESLAKKGKIVVVTDGPSSVICENSNRSYKIDVPILESEEIVDTTGAGDSFVAGFLTGYLLEKDLELCLELGCYAAQEMIKRSGSMIPDHPPSFTI